MEKHHAILFIGQSLEAVGIDIAKLRTETEIDFFDVDTLSIVEVREKIIPSAYGRPFEKETKTILIKVNQIGIEAQNALLKILEEPPTTTKFILVLRGKESLLPTLLSRLSQVDTKNVVATEYEYFSDFLKLDISSKINQIADIAKNKDGEGYDKLYSGLILWLTNNPANINRGQIHWCLNQLVKRGASKKMLWEEISFLV